MNDSTEHDDNEINLPFQNIRLHTKHFSKVKKEFVVCHNFLAEVGLEQYSNIFLCRFPVHGFESHISLYQLSLLTHDDLINLGIKNLNHIKIIIDHIENKKLLTMAGISDDNLDGSGSESSDDDLALYLNNEIYKYKPKSPTRKKSNAESTSPTLTPTIIYQTYSDDVIDCESFLNEVGMSQYIKTFAANFSLPDDDKHLSLRKLSNLRLQDFPRMNISNYNHSKTLYDHIKARQQYIDSKISTEEKYQQFMRSHSDLTIKNSTSTLPAAVKILNEEESAEDQPINKFNLEEANHIKKVNARRRKSFDNKAWESIQKLRQSEVTQNNLKNLRNGDFEALASQPLTTTSNKSNKSTNNRRRRWSHDNFDTSEADGDHPNATTSTTTSNTAITKAQLFGNMALELDMLKSDLLLLQTEILLQFKNLIKCEVANILFVTDISRELVLYAEEKWFRIPIHSSIAGACALSGEVLHVPDAYQDDRFNPFIDQATGFRTRDILCQPLRSNKGAGPVVAVIQMLNKIDRSGFDEQDQTILQNCVRKVGDELSHRFQDLLFVADKVHSTSDIISASTTSSQVRVRRFDDPTTASKYGSHRERESSLTLAEVMMKNDYNGRSSANNNNNISLYSGDTNNNNVTAFSAHGDIGSGNILLSDENRRANRRKLYGKHISTLNTTTTTSSTSGNTSNSNSNPNSNYSSSSNGSTSGTNQSSLPPLPKSRNQSIISMNDNANNNNGDTDNNNSSSNQLISTRSSLLQESLIHGLKTLRMSQLSAGGAATTSTTTTTTTTSTTSNLSLPSFSSSGNNIHNLNKNSNTSLFHLK